jgi:hypothetical protein
LGPGICVCVSVTCDLIGVGVDYVVQPLFNNFLTPQMHHGVTSTVVGNRFAVIAGLVDDPLVIVDIRPEGGITRRIPGAHKRSFAAVLAIDERLAWIIGGVDDNDVPLDLIEVVDLAFNTVSALPFALERPVARPKATFLDNAVVVVDDDDDLPQIITKDGRAILSPLIHPRAGAVAIGVGDAVVVIGGEDDKGVSRHVERIELVDLQVLPALSLPSCTVSALPDDGVIAGNTRNSVDTFRTAR